MILPLGTTILLHQKSGSEPFDWNFNSEKSQIREVEAKVLSESKMCVLVELKEHDNINQPIKCNIPKRLFLCKGSNLKSIPPTITIPVNFNLFLPIDESEKEYINPLNLKAMENETPTSKTGTNRAITTKEAAPLIYSKILAVMKEIKAIPKNNTAEGEDAFSFRGIEDIYNVVHPLLKKHEIFMTTEVLSHTTNAVGKTIVHAKFTWYASDGSFVFSTIAGEALTKDDKGTAIALSVAQRQAITQMFLIPTKEELPLLSTQQFQKALLRINGNDKDLLPKLQEQFRFKPDHLKMLTEAHKKKNK